VFWSHDMVEQEGVAMTRSASLGNSFRTIFVHTPIFALAGAPIAVIVTCLYGLPTHARVSFALMVLAGFDVIHCMDADADLSCMR
jgi:hypothetical protein